MVWAIHDVTGPLVGSVGHYLLALFVILLLRFRDTSSLGSPLWRPATPSFTVGFRGCAWRACMCMRDFQLWQVSRKQCCANAQKLTGLPRRANGRERESQGYTCSRKGRGSSPECNLGQMKLFSESIRKDPSEGNSLNFNIDLLEFRNTMHEFSHSTFELF